MEQKNYPPAAAAAIVRHDQPSMSPKSKKDKKKRGPLHLARVALFMLRRGQPKKPPLHVEAAAATTGTLTKLVGSMRPLHLHDNDNDNDNVDGKSLPGLTCVNVHVHASPKASCEHFEDVFPPPSPSDGDPSSSRYASAQNLQELDRNYEEEEEEEEEWRGQVVGEGDQMIDTKADEFIAQFYKQMGLQLLDS